MSQTVALRGAREVAERALGLLVVFGYALNPKPASAWSEQHGLQQYLSPKEQAFVGRSRLWHASPLHGKRDKMAFSWRLEAVIALFWCLGGLDELPEPDAEFDLFESEMGKLAMDEPERFVAEARLRPHEQLQAMAAYLYRQEWRGRQRSAKLGTDKPGPGDPPLDKLNDDVVHERRYAVAWVVQPDDAWDELDDGPVNG